MGDVTDLWGWRREHARFELALSDVDEEEEIDELVRLGFDEDEAEEIVMAEVKERLDREHEDA